MTEELHRQPTGESPGLWYGLAALATFLICADSRPAWDIFYHLGVGVEVLRNESLHGVDLYSYTGRGSQAEYWEWGFGVLLVLWRNLFGLEWFHILIGGIGAAASVLIALTARLKGFSGRSAALFAVWFALIIRYRMMARPHIVTLLFFVLLLVLFESNRERPRLRTPIVVFVLIYLWSCIHQGSFFGLLVIGCYFGEALLPYLARARLAAKLGLGPQDRRRLTTTAASFLLAMIAYGVAPLASIRIQFVLGALKQKVPHLATLVEYHPTKWLEHPWLLALAATAVVVVIVDRRAPRPALLAWTIGFLPISIKHSRFPVLMAVALFGLVLAHGAAIWKRRQAPPSGKKSCWAGALAGIAVVVVGLALNTDSFTKAPMKKMDYSSFPQKALEFADRIGLAGPMYNSYHFGNYLVYHYDPRRPVFIDGGREWAYRELETQYAATSPQAIAEKYNLSWALVDTRELADDASYFKFNALFRNPAKWRTVYFDETATVFVRLDGPDRQWASELGFQTIRPWRAGFGYIGAQINDSRVRALIRSEVKRASAQCPGPMQKYWEASYLDMEGQSENAIAVLRDAWARSPENDAIAGKLGELLIRDDRLNEAKSVLRRIQKIAPDKPNVLHNLGVVYLRQGKPGRAARYFHKTLEEKPDWTLALFNLGLAYEDRSKPEKAKAIYLRISKIEPNSPLAKRALERAQQLKQP